LGLGPGLVPESPCPRAGLIITQSKTPDLTWGDKSAYVHGEKERNFIENREENTRVVRISLSYNSQWWKSEFLLNY